MSGRYRWKMHAPISLSPSCRFTTSTISQYTLQTVGVDIKVSANPTSAAKDPYELSDSIVARNATRCATSGGCSVPTVS